jgi:hypothetical protein
LQLAVVFPTVYNAVPSRDRAVPVTETTLVLQSLFCNRPLKIRSFAKLELQNNACFAIEKKRYFPSSTENGWLPAAALSCLAR